MHNLYKRLHLLQLLLPVCIRFNLWGLTATTINYNFISCGRVDDTCTNCTLPSSFASVRLLHMGRLHLHSGLLQLEVYRLWGNTYISRSWLHLTIALHLLEYQLLLQVWGQDSSRQMGVHWRSDSYLSSGGDWLWVHGEVRWGSGLVLVCHLFVLGCLGEAVEEAV